MPGIRIEGKAAPGGGSIPPGFAREAQLAQAIGGDPYGGLSLAQLNAVQSGGVPFGENVRRQMAAHAEREAVASSARMQPNLFTPGFSARAGSNVAPATAGLVYSDMLSYLRNISEKENVAARQRQEELDIFRGRARSVFLPPGVSSLAGMGGGYLPPGIAGLAAMGAGPGGRPFFIGGGGGFYGGGGGGGGGFGGEGGGGFGGGGRLPFAGMVGLAATSKLLTRGIGFGIAADVIEELAMLPTVPGRIAGAMLGASEPYRNLVQRNYAFSRAMGPGIVPGGGYSALKQVYPGGGATPDWMKALGLGPAEATAMAEQFGILPGGLDERKGLVSALGALEYLPGLSGLGPEARASARTAAGYGAISPNAEGVTAYGVQLSNLLEVAIAKGMQRVDVLHSIDQSLAMAVRSGAGAVSPIDFGRFLTRFSGLPGGPSGEAGMRAAIGLQGATNTIGSNPTRTFMAATAARGIKTEADLKSFLGDSYYNDLMKNSPETIQHFFQANNSGDTFTSAMLLQAMVENNPEAQAKIFNQSSFYRGLTPGQRQVAGGNLTGQGPIPYQYYQTHPGVALPGGPAAAGMQVNNPLNLMYAPGQPGVSGIRPMSGGRLLGMYPSMAVGIAADLRQLQKYQKEGLTTVRQMVTKWVGDPGQDMTSYVNDVAKAIGVGPDTPIDINDPKVAAAWLRGAQPHESGPTRLSESDIQAGVALATGNEALPPSSVPSTILSDQAQALQTAMGGAQVAMSAMNVIIPNLNKGLENMTGAVDAVTKALLRLSRAGNNQIVIPPF